MIASLWAASDTYTITLTCGLRSQPTTGVLFPDRRFKTGIVTSPAVNQSRKAGAIEDRQFEMPFYWAGFIMVGDGSRNIRLSVNGRR